MNFLIFLSCLFFCSCNCFRVEPKISKNKEIITKSTISNIVNGFPAFNRHFFAKVRNFRNGDFCGASVLDDWWVITTATCVLLSDSMCTLKTVPLQIKSNFFFFFRYFLFRLFYHLSDIVIQSSET